MTERGQVTMMAPAILNGRRLILRPVSDTGRRVLDGENRDAEFLRLVGEDKSSRRRMSDAEFDALTRRPDNGIAGERISNQK